jgi:predicted nucleic acid-binding protein
MGYADLISRLQVLPEAEQSEVVILSSEDMQHGLLVEGQLTIVNPLRAGILGA